MGLFVAISTRTPTTSICLTAAPSLSAPARCGIQRVCLLAFPFCLQALPLSKYTRKRGRRRHGPGRSRTGPLHSAAVRSLVGMRLAETAFGQTGFGQRAVDERAVQSQHECAELAGGAAR